MTSIDNVTDLTPRVRYVASAAQNEFDFPFPIFQSADLVVDVDGVVQVLETDYTVTGVGEDLGGTIALAATLDGGEIVTIYRDTVIERTTDVQQNGPIASSTTNDELDKLFIIAQELKAKNERALRFPFNAAATAAQTEFNPLTSWLGKYIYINSSGVPEPAAAVSSTVLTQAIIAELLNPRTSAEVSASVVPTSYNYDARPMIDLARYGAVADGTTDNSAAFNKAIDVAAVLGGARIQLSPGFTAIGSSIIIDTPNVSIVGCGPKGSIVKALNSSFDLFQPRANYINFQAMGFYGASATATDEQWGIFTEEAYAPTHLTVRDCYFGGSATNARLNDAIKFDASCDFGKVVDVEIDNMVGVDSGGGYGILAGAVDGLFIHGVRGAGTSGTHGRHMVYLSTGARFCVVSQCFGQDWNSETYTMNALLSQPANAYNIFDSCISWRGNPLNTSTGAFSCFGTAEGNIWRNCIAYQPGNKGFMLQAASGASDCASHNNLFDNCTSINSGLQGLDIQGTTGTMVKGGMYINASQSSLHISSNIRILATAAGTAVVGCELHGVTARGGDAAYAFEINASAPLPTGTILRGNNFQAGFSGAIGNAGSATYDGEKGGIATIPSGATQIVVTHLLGITPSAHQITVVANENPTNDHGNLWVSAIGATTFTINCRADPGASNLDIAWHYSPAQ